MTRVKKKRGQKQRDGESNREERKNNSREGIKSAKERRVGKNRDEESNREEKKE